MDDAAGSWAHSNYSIADYYQDQWESFEREGRWRMLCVLSEPRSIGYRAARAAYAKDGGK